MTSNKSKILVTGVNGFLGSFIVDELVLRGYNICGFVRDKKRLKDNRIFEVCEGDLSNHQSIKEAMKEIEVIFHLACSLSTDKKEVKNIDVKGMKLLLKNWKGEVFIYISSIDVYGFPKKIPITENHPLSPKTYYGYGKLLCEKELISVAKKQVYKNFMIFRLPYIFGAHPKFFMSFLGKMIEKAIKGENLSIPSGESSGISWISAKDCALALANCIENFHPGIFNLSNGFLLWNEMASKVIQATKSKSKINLLPFKGDKMELSSEKAREILGFKPIFLFDDVLESIIHRQVCTTYS